jgi:hypothetical protein
MHSTLYSWVGIVTASSNGYFVTVTEAKQIVSVKSLLLQRHKIGSATLLPLQRHKKTLPVTLLPLVTVNNAVALVTLL